MIDYSQVSFRKAYIKPSVDVVELKGWGIICTSPNAYNLGGAGVYDEEIIVDNGDY